MIQNWRSVVGQRVILDVVSVLRYSLRHAKLFSGRPQVGTLSFLDSVFGVLDKFELVFQVENEVSEVEWVHVLGEHVKEEPITDAAVLEHLANCLWVGDAAMRVRCHDAHSRVKEGKSAVDKGKTADEGKEVEPEPEEDVHLLVDDVNGQNAHSIVSLHVT